MKTERNAISTKEVKMLNRDFTRSNIDYIKKNRIPLIAVSLFLIIGLVMALVFGFNGNFELKGYNEFGVTVGTMDKKGRKDVVDEAKKIINSYDGSYESFSIVGEGANTEIIIKYTKNVSNEEQVKISKEISEEVGVDISLISPHTHVDGSVRAEDYIFAATAILIILLVASIFAMIRYNVASAISLIATSAIGSLAYMSFASILRLSIGLSYFAMLVALNVLIVYFAFNIFETIRKESWLKSKDYVMAIKSSLNHNKFRFNFIAIAMMVIGLLFVIIGTTAIKYVSINIMFMAVSVLAASCYVLPFVWSMLIAYNKLKISKTVNSDQKNK